MEVGGSKLQYGAITGAYWAFTLTDGALRMLVLLFLHEQGRSPLEIAGLFLFYEFFGVVTNLCGGALGARFGLRSTLLIGLLFQVTALGVLGWQHAQLSMVLVMAMQSLSGVAKDLTKMSAKSFMKFLVPEGDGKGLMRIVSWLTGSKNTLKGAGFFLGGWLLGTFGFREACLRMAAMLLLTFLLSWALLPKAFGKAKQVGALSDWLTQDRRVFWLSMSRMALFASRDVWFVLALPLYLSSQLGWSYSRVGGFLALWIIGYGLVQALAPGWVGRPAKGEGTAGIWLFGWTVSLCIPLTWLLNAGNQTGLELLIGLGAFGLLFATCSSLHSYLILAYADGEKVAQQVGAYYAANALGRFVGTLLSGFLYQQAVNPDAGLRNSLIAAIVLAGGAGLLCLPLELSERRGRR